MISWYFVDYSPVLYSPVSAVRPRLSLRHVRGCVLTSLLSGSILQDYVQTVSEVMRIALKAVAIAKHFTSAPREYRRRMSRVSVGLRKWKLWEADRANVRAGEKA